MLGPEILDALSRVAPPGISCALEDFMRKPKDFLPEMLVLDFRDRWVFEFDDDSQRSLSMPRSSASGESHRPLIFSLCS